MSFTTITEDIHYYDSAVNIGYVKKGSTGLLIDAGIDRSAAKKVMKEIEEKNWPLTHLFITHAHADHYGGAAFVRNKYKVETWAPPLEAAIMEHPVIEPLYLHGGNDPLPEMRNKFLEGPPVTIDMLREEGEVRIGDIHANVFILPGHSYRQAGLVIDGILFAADSYFGVDYLHKHKIPYITDAHLQLETLNRLLDMEVSGAVPGHGEFENNFRDTVKENIKYHQEAMDWVEGFIKEEEEVSHETLVAAMCEAYDVSVTKMPAWMLYRTAVTAYINGLLRNEKISGYLKDYRWTFSIL
ncbi:MBL fold metallo-hydrolase [Salimicrobium halophilum]|uniref:Glyoxylase, beta-lactamase superfamily II n=1 Tax=Salimicrobium halophilum TaxID=86666 RepID=A0A1G8TUF9_9BACI|nr:MBL fold metallo-hydrolase [Salimicrobium halophilum]SDJ45206.1 Glyoxylase, beta-lactamase superfamily II [Salimicrobium halophilum]